MTTRFGDNLRALRRARELTQEELADQLGVSFQAVSKWERGETYPDIMTLPRLSGLFGVTVDALLGVDAAAQETAILSVIDDYARLWAAGEMEALRDRLHAAMRDYPGDYRLIVRYLNVLTAMAIRSGDPCSVRVEVAGLYASILDHCTVDSIRIWAKKLMADYYRRLCEVEGSGVGEADILAILAEMPLMQNGRDFAATYLLTGEAKRSACASATVELAYLLLRVLMERATTDAAPAEQVLTLETGLSVVAQLFPDGDYGKLTPGVIRAHRMLAEALCRCGETERAEAVLASARTIADAFDAPDRDAVLVCTSPTVAGVTVVKHRVPFVDGRGQAERLREFAARLRLGG